jgi:hypothetical protein
VEASAAGDVVEDGAGVDLRFGAVLEVLTCAFTCPARFDFR